MRGPKRIAAKAALNKRDCDYGRNVAKEIISAQMYMHGGSTTPNKKETKAAVERRARQDYGLGFFSKIKLYLVISWTLDLIDEIFEENGWG